MANAIAKGSEPAPTVAYRRRLSNSAFVLATVYLLDLEPHDLCTFSGTNILHVDI